MPDRPGDDKPRLDGEHVVEFAKIDAGTKRTQMVCWTVLISTGMVCLTIVWSNASPMGLFQFLSALGVSLFGPAGVMTMLIKSRTKFVNKHHRRMVNYEKRIDGGRTSSDDDPQEPSP